MAKLIYKFDSAFEYKVPKKEVKLALLDELCDSFMVTREKNTCDMLEYLIDNFFLEFFDFFESELLVRFESQARISCGGDFS